MKSSKDKRPDWDSYFLKLAHVVKERSNCLRQSVGVVLVKDKRIIATGYNGTPAGVKNCIDGGCLRCLRRDKNVLKPYEQKELCICIHAEQNALLQCAYHGVSARGATMYSTVAPCVSCAKHVINAGISKIIYKDNHSDKLGRDLLKSAQVSVIKVE